MNRVKKDRGEVVSFNEVRAERENDSSLWTPKEALVRLLRDIEQGKRNPTMMYVCVAESSGKGTEMLYHYCAGGSNLEYAGLLTWHLHDLAREVSD